MKYRVLAGLTLAGIATAFACGKPEDSKPTDSSGGTGSSGTTNTDGTCALTNNTTVTSTTNSLGCPLLTRDVSSCAASRTAQGISGAWLKYSCRVTLTKTGSNIVVATDGLPDYKSPYFTSSDACYTDMSAAATSANHVE